MHAFSVLTVAAAVAVANAVVAITGAFAAAVAVFAVAASAASVAWAIATVHKPCSNPPAPQGAGGLLRRRVSVVRLLRHL
jgi:hypothetical protein